MIICLISFDNVANFMAFVPKSNHADWATAAGRQILVPNFADRRESRGQCGPSPTADNLGYPEPEPLIFFQVAPQLSSRGWVDPVPDPLLLRKSESDGNRTRDLWVCSRLPNISNGNNIVSILCKDLEYADRNFCGEACNDVFRSNQTINTSGRQLSVTADTKLVADYVPAVGDQQSHFSGDDRRFLCGPRKNTSSQSLEFSSVRTGVGSSDPEGS
jgi:hypothetical protein